MLSEMLSMPHGTSIVEKSHIDLDLVNARGDYVASRTYIKSAASSANNSLYIYGRYLEWVGGQKTAFAMRYWLRCDVEANVEP